jgi:hypothetical protein
MKRMLFVLLSLIASTGIAFADGSSWMTSYNKPGQLNGYASVGLYGYGLDGSVAGEYIAGQFDVGSVPFEWGVEGRGVVGFASYLGYANWIDWGVGPLAKLHFGVDFGKPWKFDLYVGAGLGISGSTGEYWGSGVHFGFASWDGVAWHFSDKMALISEGGYIGNTSSWGLGLEMNL